MAEENVLHLPSLLDRLATRLRDYLWRDKANREEWITTQTGICATLAEARGLFSADIEFGRWCDDNEFGADVINHQTRSAAIAMGRDPDALVKCLYATQYRSIERIYRHDFNRFTTGRKPTDRRKDKTKTDQKRRPSPKTDKAKDAFDQLEAQGVYPGRTAVSKAAGVSEHVAQLAIAAKRSEPDAEPLPREDMRATMQKRFDAAIRKARMEVREELKEEVYAELDVFVRHAKERSERADRVLASHKGVMSRDLFRKIKACLHPDQCKFIHAAEALQAFSELEKVLVKADEPIPSGPPLPTTAAELMARRRQRETRQ